MPIDTDFLKILKEGLPSLAKELGKRLPGKTNILDNNGSIAVKHYRTKTLNLPPIHTNAKSKLHGEPRLIALLGCGKVPNALAGVVLEGQL